MTQTYNDRHNETHSYEHEQIKKPKTYTNTPILTTTIALRHTYLHKHKNKRTDFFRKKSNKLNYYIKEM